MVVRVAVVEGPYLHEITHAACLMEQILAINGICYSELIVMMSQVVLLARLTVLRNQFLNHCKKAK